MSEPRATMKKVIIPSLTGERALIDAQLPGIWQGWRDAQPPGNYTCMDTVVEPWGGIWRVVLYVVEDPV